MPRGLLRTQPKRSFAEIAKILILLVVIDWGNHDGKVPRDKWRWVEGAPAAKCFELLPKEQGSPPVCTDVGWF